jgi:hypothetical protein
MMISYRVIAKDDLEMGVHTWTKGLNYEVVEKEDYFTLASDQGQVNYFNEVKEVVLGMFERENK